MCVKTMINARLQIINRSSAYYIILPKDSCCFQLFVISGYWNNSLPTSKQQLRQIGDENHAIKWDQIQSKSRK